MRLAEGLAAAGQKQDAINQLKEAIKLDPKHVGAYLDLGVVLIDMKDLKGAEAALKKVVDLTEGAEYESINTQREDALFRLGALLLSEKRYDDAIGYLKGALRIRRDASDTYLALAKAYHGQGALDSAVEQLDIALAYDPNYAMARYELGTILKAQGKPVQAAEQFRRATDLAPDAAPPKAALAAYGPADKYMALAQAAVKRGDTGKASENVRIALAIDPKNVTAALIYASGLEKSGKRTAALQAYRQILTDIDANNATAKAAVARLTRKK